MKKNQLKVALTKTGSFNSYPFSQINDKIVTSGLENIKTATINEFGPYQSQYKLIESKNNIFVLSEYTQDGRDSLILKSIDNKIEINFGGKWNAPCYADWGFEKEKLKIIYTAWINNQWKLVETDIYNNDILTERVIPSKIHSFRAKFLLNNNELILIQTQSDLKHQFISLQKKISSGWQKECFILSDINTFSSRPNITILKDKIFVIWDSYNGKDYNIFARIYNGKWSNILKISNNKGWNLKPICAPYNEDEIIVVWINKIDVTSSEGIIDQKHSIWGAFVGKDGQVKDMGYLSDLTHGILAKLSPKPEAVWGYMGRRRYPMIKTTEENSQAYILWERKLKRDEGTDKASGELCVLPVIKGKKEKLLSLRRGMIFYDVDSKKKIRNGKFIVGALKGRFGKERTFSIFELNINKNYPSLKDENYDEWRKISLPLDESKNYKKKDLFWGDIHVHTGNSTSDDAQGELDEIYHYARDKALLDFIAVTDNDSYLLDMKESEWFFDKFYADFFNKEGKFVTLQGFEWSSAGDKGKVNHRSVLMDSAPMNIPRWTLIGAEIENLVKIAEERDWILHPHHQKWRLSKSVCERNIEATSGWDIYIEKGKDIFQALNNGFKGGIIGGSDSHRRNPGLCGALTALFTEKLTRKSVLEALRKNQCYVTNGSRIIINFFLKKKYNGYPKFTIEVISLEIIDKIKIIRNGEIVMLKDVMAKKISFEWKDNNLEKGKYWYILKVSINRPNIFYPSNLTIARGGLAWAGPLRVDI